MALPEKIHAATWATHAEDIANDMVQQEWVDYANSSEKTDDLARQGISTLIGLAIIGHLDTYWDAPIAPTAPIQTAQKKLLTTPPHVAAPLWLHVQRAFKQPEFQARARNLGFPQVKEALTPTGEQLWETCRCHNDTLVAAANCVAAVIEEPPLRFRSQLRKVLEQSREYYPEVLLSHEYLVERGVRGPRFVLLTDIDTIEQLPDRDPAVPSSRDKFNWDRSRRWV